MSCIIFYIKRRMQELSTAIINEETLQNIADSIRDKNKKN